MAVNIYKDGQWHSLAGNRIWSSENNEWVQVKDIDQLRFNSQWNTIGYQGSDNPSVQVPDNAPEPSYKKVAGSSDGNNSPTLGSGNRIIYVSPNGSGDGTSWANATDIDGMNYLLQMSNPGDLVYLLGGKYEVSTTIFVPDGIRIYGGFKPENPAWGTRYNMGNQTWETVLECATSIKFPLFKFLEKESSVERIVSSVSATGFSDIATSDSVHDATIKRAVFRGFTGFSYNGLLQSVGIYGCGNVNVNNITNVIIESEGASTVCVNGTVGGSYGTTIIHNGSGEVKFTSSLDINRAYVHTETGSIVFDKRGNILQECVLSSTSGYLKAESKTIEGALVYVSGNVNVSSIKARMNGSEIASKAIVVGASNVEALFVENCKFKSCNCVNMQISNSNTFYKINEIFIGYSYNDFYSSIKGKITIFETDKCTFVNCENYDYTTDKSSFFDKFCGEIDNDIIVANEMTLSGDKITSIQDICCDNTNVCYYCLVNGKLCHYSKSNGFSVISEEEGWTAVNSHYGICNGKLYSLYTDRVVQIGNLTGWTTVSGYYDTRSTGFSSYGYGIRSGQLYQLENSTAVRKYRELEGWTAIIGYSSGYPQTKATSAFGICNGMLYGISHAESTPTQIGTSNEWTIITGCAGYRDGTGYIYAYGICGGKLYCLKNKNIVCEQIGTSDKWTLINSTDDSGRVAYGICDGELYKIKDGKAEKIFSKEINAYSCVDNDFVFGRNFVGFNFQNHYCFEFKEKQYILGNIINFSTVGVKVILLLNDYKRIKEKHLNLISESKLMSLFNAMDTKFINCSLNSRLLINCLKINNLNCDVYFENSLKTQSDLLEGKKDGVFTNDNYYSSNYIYDGELYYYYKDINDRKGKYPYKGWTAVSGSYDTGTVQYYGYGICNGSLYRLEGSGRISKIGSSDKWTAVSGYTESNRDYHAYGICDGELHRIDNSSVYKVHDSNKWTAISGYTAIHYTMDNKDYWIDAFGICDGKLYRLSANGRYIYQINNLTGCTCVKGHASTYGDYAYAICDGVLYALGNIYPDYVTKIENPIGWTMISGHYSDICYAYGICNGKLYELKKSSINQIGDSTAWTFIHRSGSDVYGICDLKLYKIKRNGNSSTLSYCNILLNDMPDVNKIGFANGTVIFKGSLSDLNNYETKQIANCSTIVNSRVCGIIDDGNVFYNCTGNFSREGNAVTNAVDAKVNLGPTTMNTEFVNKGFTPSTGIQDVGECPDPDENPNGYNEWMSQFGDWHPKEGSLLLNPRFKGTYDESITTDLDGNTRNDPPTLGCYEQ